MRILTDLMSSESAESRAHPDKTRDVWEIAVWDPLPICLQMFCLFSPGHVLVHMMFLPLEIRDPRPSVTVFNCLVLQVILSVQMLLLQTRFAQQNKDTAIIQKEVMHEYDTKFVHPRLYPTVRDASTQLSDHDAAVEVGTPTVQLRRGFQTRPNLNYVKHIDPEGFSTPPRQKASYDPIITPHARRPTTARPEALRSSLGDANVITRRSTPGLPTPMNPSQSRPATSSIATSTSTSTGTSTGTNMGANPGAAAPNTAASGAYLGIYNHPKSPLKKAAPNLGDLGFRSPRNNSEMAQLEQYEAYRKREGSASPLKGAARKSVGAGGAANAAPAPVPIAWDRPQPRSYERYPSMWGGGR